MGPVRSIGFLLQSGFLASTSDDKTVRIWSVTDGQQVCSFSNHTDYIRTLSVLESSPNLFASGSYDGKVCIFNTETQSCVLSLNHEVAVECVKLYGSMAISCGGNVIKIWDVSAGGKLLETIECHQKTISCMALTPNKRFLLTGSLDRQVKVIDMNSFEMVGAFKLDAAVMSLSVNVNYFLLILFNC